MKWVIEVSYFIVAVLFILGLSIPVTLALARSVSNSLRQLNREAESIRRFEFERRVRADSFIVEVSELAHTMDEMKSAIRHFLDVSQRVAAENDFDRLLPRLLEETMAAAKASLGVLYLADDEALNAAAALGADGELPLPEKTLLPARLARDEWRAAFAANEPTSLRLNAELVAALGLSALPGLERLNHVIVVPLRNREQHCVGGVLLLREGETNRNRLGFIGALSTSSSLSLEAKELPLRVPGKFTLAQVKDEERGRCLELTLNRSGTLPDIVSEYTALRLKNPLPVKQAGDAIGLWVKGDSGWGKIIFELEDAQGAQWRTEGVWHDWPGDLAVCHDGWRFMGYPIDGLSRARNLSPGSRWNSTSAKHGKVPQFPVKIAGLTVVMNRRALDLTDMKDVAGVLRFRDIGICTVRD